MQNDRDTFRTILIAAFFALAVGITGTFDYENELIELDIYCQNVHTGVWPDYEGSYKEQCYEGHHKTDR